MRRIIGEKCVWMDYSILTNCVFSSSFSLSAVLGIFMVFGNVHEYLSPTEII